MKKAGGQGMLNEKAFRDMIDAFGFDAWTVSRPAAAEVEKEGVELTVDG